MAQDALKVLTLNFYIMFLHLIKTEKQHIKINKLSNKKCDNITIRQAMDKFLRQLG